MHIHLIAVGKRMPKWVTDSFNEYNKRLPSDFYINLKEITPASCSKNSSIEKILKDEAISITAKIPKNSTLVILDEKGKQLTSQGFAKKIAALGELKPHICFVIGGADGIHNDLKHKADMLLSLSSMTCPHALVRVLLAEQIYRSWSILNNHPYHRE